jgi:hypothetical protein
LWRRAGRRPESLRDENSRFSLGKLGLPINIAAVVWSACMIVNVGWPRAATYGPEWQHRFAPVIMTMILIVSGTFVRQLVVSRGTVTPEAAASQRRTTAAP